MEGPAASVFRVVADTLIFSFLTTDLSTQICHDLTELKQKAVRQEVKEATEIVKTWKKSSAGEATNSTTV